MDAFAPVIAVHALCALYVILLGPLQILRRRRDRAHRILGTTWVFSMVLTCTTSFFIHPDGFSWLHVLSIWTLICMVVAITAIRRGNVPTHRGYMVGSYLGTLVAFGFATLAPGRAIQHLLHQEPIVVVIAFGGMVLLAGAGALLVIRGAAQRERVPARA